jgi:hypothetical protein
MYKIINILFFIAVLQTSLFANTTKEDVDEYLNICRGQGLIKDAYMFKYKKYFPIIYGIDIKNADQHMIEKYDALMLNPKYRDDFYNILRQLDDNSYFEIMAFYKTKLGKKYAQAFNKLYDDGTAKSLSIYLQQKSNVPLLEGRRKLVTEINNALNYSNLHKDFKTISFNMNKNKIPLTLIEDKKYNVIFTEYFEILSEFAYKNFSDEELSQVLIYAKRYGHIEMKHFYEALSLYSEHAYKDLYEFIEKEKLSESNKTKAK